jgi:hypothetical protein
LPYCDSSLFGGNIFMTKNPFVFFRKFSLKYLYITATNIRRKLFVYAWLNMWDIRS